VAADVQVRPLDESDRDWLTVFMTASWGAPVAVAGGRVLHLDRLPGFAAIGRDGEVAGVVTYVVDGDECEIASIDAVEEGRGVGTALIEEACDAAAGLGCRRVHLVTTNDNLRALRFYQRRGFVLAELRPRAIEQSRRIKPAIPETGFHGIPIRDELVLVRELRLP
jgi:ribosomal protein S18 acetylase RimI-like enzyme